MLGGSLMVIAGILYLIFEDKLLADQSSSVRVNLTRKDRRISRALIGVQVGYLLLLTHRNGSLINYL